MSRTLSYALAPMGERQLWQAIRYLAWFLGLAYVVIGIVGAALIDFDSGGARALWLSFLIAGGILLIAGLRLAGRSRWQTFAVLTIGAVLGSLVIFWAVVPAAAAIALIVLTFLWARRPAVAA